MNMLWRVQMSIRKKLALTGILSLVVVTMVIAIVRVTVVSALTRQLEISWLYIWSSIEQCIGKSIVIHNIVSPLTLGTCQLTKWNAAIIVSCLGSFRALFSRQDSRKPGPQRSLIHASRNMFLRGTKRVRSSDQSISLTGLTGDSIQYSTYVRTGDAELSVDNLKEAEDGQLRALDSVLVKRGFDVEHVDRQPQNLV